MQRRIGFGLAAFALGAAVLARTTMAETAPTAPPSMFSSIPMLRVEVGRHSSTIKSLAVDASGRYLVTAGDDKTVRVWELPNEAHKDLQPLEVLRPPIDGSTVGLIYAVAISPDGSRIAVGGELGASPQDRCLYIFDRVTGRIVNTLAAPGYGSTLQIQFSPDGAYLAAGFEYSVHVWRAADWQEAGKDENYSGKVYGLAFDSKDRLAAASMDGAIRLYDKQFSTPVQRLAMGAGIVPWRVAFSRDDKRLAVGHSEAGEVTLFDVASDNFADRTELTGPGFTPGHGGESQDELSEVAWSGDGRSLLVAGGQNDQSVHPIYTWRIGSAAHALTGYPTESTNRISAIAAFGASGVVMAATDPLIAAYDEAGTRMFAIGSTLRDFRTWANGSDAADFRVSQDATIVDVPGKMLTLPPRAAAPLKIDLAAQRVTAVNAPDPALAAPIQASAAFQVDDWQNALHPRLQRAGAPHARLLHLDHNEKVHALAIAPDNTWFALGTTWAIKLFDADGNRLQDVDLPATTWRLNIAPGGRTLVAAGDDGIVRWFAVRRTADGKPQIEEILDLYANEPDHRWVAWTPNGFYDASAGGEDLIGWHINRGPAKAALFYSASRFRDTYYRPDIVRQVVQTGIVPPAPDPRALLERLPPIVHILGIAQSQSGEAVVSYVVDSPTDKPVTDLRVMIDGALQDRRGAKDLIQEGETNTIAVKLPAGADPAQVSLSASNGNGHSDAVTQTFKPTVAAPGTPAAGDLYALVVGVGNFSDKTITPKLKYSVDDANAVAAVLRAQQGVAYAHVIVKVLTNEQATREAIQNGLDWLTDAPTANDVSLLYLSGHGVKRQRTGSGAQTNEYLFVTYDSDYGHDQLGSTGLKSSAIVDYVQNTRAKKLIFLDTCHAGQLGEHDVAGFANSLGQNQWGAIVWASSTGDEESLELDSYRHGAFTEALLDAFYGREGFAARTRAGRITQRKLSDWLDDRVPELTNDQQRPEPVDLSGAAFDIANIVPAPK